AGRPFAAENSTSQASGGREPPVSTAVACGWLVQQGAHAPRSPTGSLGPSTRLRFQASLTISLVATTRAEQFYGYAESDNDDGEEDIASE
ncbi:MAG: hypothetical protein KDA44_07575, partial [Planctomycetales bacterium]|nr:hypothetical protein [Planctomycetales bacterium]